MIIQDKNYKVLGYYVSFSRWGKYESRVGRFGGGWKYKLGIQMGGSSIIINLLYGMIRISKES